MEFTPVDLIVNGNKKELNGVVDSNIVHNRKWHIDEILGKDLCRIEVKIPQRGMSFNFIPPDDFYEGFIDKLLEAEFNNDTFIFENPKVDPNRPAQLEIKIERIEKILEKWRVRAKVITQSTTEPAENLVPEVEEQLKQQGEHLHSIQDEVYTPPKPMKKCWHCQKNAMKEVPELKGWFRCQECGATEVK